VSDIMRTLTGAIIAACVVVSGPAWSENGKVLFAPDLQAHPKEEAGYPRLVRLEHSGQANGALLATFAHAGGALSKGDLPIYRSNDGGASWSPEIRRYCL
jgi:hypothetical protein